VLRFGDSKIESSDNNGINWGKVRGASVHPVVEWLSIKNILIEVRLG